MSTATIRELRTSFPKIRTRIEREGEVIITDRGKAAFVLRAYTEQPKKSKAQPDYYARLLSYMPKPISREAMEALDDANRGDR
jgi:antitoxin (DNA-binding transcriptional repressor) of toxin-antitoxin stability system